MALRVGLIGLVLEACGLGWVYLRALSGACGLDPARTAGGRHQLGVWYFPLLFGGGGEAASDN